MNRKKTMWVAIGVVAVAIVSAVVLIKVFLHDRNGDTKREPTPTIPAEIPAGSVLVWRRNAEYFTKNDEKERLLYKYEYDEYGNYVKMIFDLEDPDYPTHEFTDFVMHPLVLEQDKVEHGKEFYCPVDFEP